MASSALRSVEDRNQLEDAELATLDEDKIDSCVAPIF